MDRVLFAASLVLAGALLSASPAIARSQAAPPPVAQSTPVSAPGAAATVLHANASLVLVDVVATERDKAVHGLDRGQFHIFEDGREQAITAFDEHRPASAPPAANHQEALPPHTYSNVPPYPEASAVNVLLLDALNTPVSGQMNVRRQMILFMGKIAPGTPLAIFTLSSRLRLVEGFTTDVSRLTKALQSSKAGAQPSVVLDPETDQAMDASIGEMANMGAGNNALSYGASALSSLEQFQADMAAFQTDLRVRMTLDAMQQLARYLSGIPGRKNLVWFSGSFPIALDPDDSQESPFEAMRNYSDDIRETDELLSASRVAVYPVDARGLMTLSSVDASYAPSSNLMGGSVNGGRGGARHNATSNKPNTGKDDLTNMKQMMQEEATMEQIAVETGGREYINTNGLKEAVADAIENGSSYYTIGYVPAAKQLDGQFRKVQIRVDSRDCKLSYRHGYYADPPDQPSAHNPGATSLIRAATLHGAPPATQILFQARALPSSDPAVQGAKQPSGPAGELASTLKGPLRRFIVDLKVDPHGFVFADAPDGALHAKVEFSLVAYDGDGQRVNYLDSGFQMNMKAAQYAAALAKGIPVRFAIDVPAGQVSLRIAVHDLNAGRAGSLEIPLDVAAR